MSRNQEALIDIIAAIKLIAQYTKGITPAALAANSKNKTPIHFQCPPHPQPFKSSPSIVRPIP